MYRVRPDQLGALEAFVSDEILCSAPEDGRVLGGAWLDKMGRGGKSRQVAGWEPAELDQYDSPRAFVAVLLEVVDVPAAHKLRVEWRRVLEDGTVDTQGDVYKRSKRFEVKRETVPKADRTNDSGAALRGLGQALATNTDRAMDGAQRASDQLVRLQGDYFDRILLLQERHAGRLDEEQASIISLMDERADLMADARVAELRLELAEVRASSDMMAQALQGAIVVLAPLAQALTTRLVGPIAGGQAQPQEHDRLARLEAQVAAVVAALAPPPGDLAGGTASGPA